MRGIFRNEGFGDGASGCLCRQLENEGVVVETGRFGAKMAVALINDGPVTIWMNSRET